MKGGWVDHPLWQVPASVEVNCVFNSHQGYGNCQLPFFFLFFKTKLFIYFIPLGFIWIYVIYELLVVFDYMVLLFPCYVHCRVYESIIIIISFGIIKDFYGVHFTLCFILFVYLGNLRVIVLFADGWQSEAEAGGKWAVVESAEVCIAW